MSDPFGLGLRQDENRLAEANPEWSRAYAEEAARIASALGPLVVAIEHYGSTSVPGLPAKPIIDLLVGVRRLSDAAASGPSMAALGYEDRGREIVPGHHIYGKGLARTHLAHFVEYGQEEWIVTLRFRDRLRRDPRLRDDYAALKRRLVVEHPTDRRAYTAAKTAFVQRVLAL
ncbi:GrpB family protein [Phenylobacterium hankyongense]|uniref:GrpB family protein n=1 Tax=Phenylobacterium hankyongense TaxID=1813876 RepID=A0A328AZN7_9CAUL|nr:GrpB family protein [Phenylobacterium hankyongense]RAK60077.1 GrpB family protein [Phenylobacterium hankyongense]